MRKSFCGSFVRLAAIAVMPLFLMSPLAAQNFPERMITVVVPLPAGGTADTLARIAADKIRTGLSQQVVVENRPGGAGGLVGTEQVWRSPADGYTLLVAPQLTFSVNHLLFPNQKFDTRTFEPVSVIARYPTVLVGKPGLPANNLAELLAYARANPGKVNYASQGKGQIGHLTVAMIEHLANVQMVQVPYRGSAPAITDLLAGQVDILADNLLATKGHVDGGKLKFLGTGGRERLPEFPSVATFAEALPGAYSDTWMAIVAPPGTPKEVTQKISDAISKGLKQADAAERIRGLQAEPMGSTPDEMRALIRQSAERWEPIIKAANITVD
ncbi:MAG: tripartite tricarboxylate transporter substrate binding protein [Microvirga sp.]